MTPTEQVTAQEIADLMQSMPGPGAPARERAAADAGRRRDRIKLLLSAMTTTTEKIADLLDAAQAEQDHVALGYASWPAYMAGEFADALAGLSAAVRRPAVVALAEGGLSTRAIAEIAGVGQSTVGRDLQVTRSGSPGEAGPVRSAKLEQRRAFFDSDEEMRDAEVMADASDDDFEAALTAAREQDDLSQGNVVANLPAKRVTGTDGKSYSARAEACKPQRSPLPDSYRRAMWELRKSTERLERLHADDRFLANRTALNNLHWRQLSDVQSLVDAVDMDLRGHNQCSDCDERMLPDDKDEIRCKTCREVER